MMERDPSFSGVVSSPLPLLTFAWCPAWDNVKFIQSKCTWCESSSESKHLPMLEIRIHLRKQVVCRDRGTQKSQVRNSKLCSSGWHLLAVRSRWVCTHGTCRCDLQLGLCSYRRPTTEHCWAGVSVFVPALPPPVYSKPGTFLCAKDKGWTKESSHWVRKLWSFCSREQLRKQREQEIMYHTYHCRDWWIFGLL